MNRAPVGSIEDSRLALFRELLRAADAFDEETLKVAYRKFRRLSRSCCVL